MNHSDIPAVAIQLTRNTLLASIQVDLEDSIIERFKEDLLGQLHETGARGVILDLSGLEILDSHEFAALRRIITMSEIMGARSILAGMRPGVVSALVEAGADVDGLRTAINLDAAFLMLEPEPEEEPELEPGPESEQLSEEPGEGVGPGFPVAGESLTSADGQTEGSKG